MTARPTGSSDNRKMMIVKWLASRLTGICAFVVVIMASSIMFGVDLSLAEFLTVCVGMVASAAARDCFADE